MYMYESLDNEEVSLETRQVHTCIHPRFLFVDVDEDEDIAKCGRARVMPSEQPISGKWHQHRYSNCCLG